MDCYAIWVDLAPGVDDLALVDALEAFLGYLKSHGRIENWSVQRRKLGFGPDGLGEFFLQLFFRDLAQLDSAFLRTATRDPEVEPLHAAVFSKVVNFRSALYRAFPDPVRMR